MINIYKNYKKQKPVFFSVAKSNVNDYTNITCLLYIINNIF